MALSPWKTLVRTSSMAQVSAAVWGCTLMPCLLGELASYFSSSAFLFSNLGLHVSHAQSLHWLQSREAVECPTFIVKSHVDVVLSNSSESLLEQGIGTGGPRSPFHRHHRQLEPPQLLLSLHHSAELFFGICSPPWYFHPQVHPYCLDSPYCPIAGLAMSGPWAPFPLVPLCNLPGAGGGRDENSNLLHVFLR